METGFGKTGVGDRLEGCLYVGFVINVQSNNWGFGYLTDYIYRRHAHTEQRSLAPLSFEHRMFDSLVYSHQDLSYRTWNMGQ